MKIVAFVPFVAAVVLASFCGNGTTQPTATPVSLAIGNPGALVGTGQTSQLTATATLSSGGTETVTSSATWQSSNTSVATVTSGGVVTEQAFGQTTITATYQGLSATTVVIAVPNFAGTWSETDVNDDGVAETLTIALTQTSASVSGTMAFLVPGFTLAAGAFTGTIDAATLTWSAMLSETADSSCQGTLAGAATVAGSSLTLTNLTLNGSLSGCGDASGVTTPPPNTSVVLTKQ